MQRLLDGDAPCKGNRRRAARFFYASIPSRQPDVFDSGIQPRPFDERCEWHALPDRGTDAAQATTCALERDRERTCRFTREFLVADLKRRTNAPGDSQL